MIDSERGAGSSLAPPFARTGRKRHALPLGEVLKGVASSPTGAADLNAAIREFMPALGTVRLDPYSPGGLLVDDRHLGHPLFFEELSSGTRRMLLLAALYVSPRPPCIIMLEEPEMGLHPAVAPAMRDLLRSLAHKSNVIVTSHSPTLIELLDPAREVVVLERGAEPGHVARAQPLSKSLASAGPFRAFVRSAAARARGREDR